MPETSDPLSPAALLKYLRDDLAPWVAARKGKVEIAGNPGDVLEQLSEKPAGAFRVVLAWGGDDDQAGISEAGIVDNVLEVWLMKARGLALKKGEQMVTAKSETDPAFLDLLSDLRKRCRSLLWPGDATDGQLFYKGSKPFPSIELAYDLPTTGFKLSFTLAAAVPWDELREPGVDA